MKSILNSILKFCKWVWLSSANPQAVSLTIKAVTPLIISSVIMIAGEFQFTLDPNQLQSYSNSIVIIVTGLLTIIGVIRKLYNTYGDKEIVTFTKKKKNTK